MEKQEILDKLIGFTKKALANQDAQIDPAAKLIDQGLNSSGRLELFTMIEDEWDLMIDEDDQDEVATLNDAVALVEKMLA